MSQELLAGAVVPVLCEQLCRTRKLLRKIHLLDELHLSPRSLCSDTAMFKQQNLGATLQGRGFPTPCEQGLFLVCLSFTPEPKHISGQ